MNTVERFFRRYIFSTIGIIALFFVVNLLLVGIFFTIAYLNGVADSNFPIEDFSNHIIVEDGKLTADTQALDILHHADAWAMILNDDGTVIWEDGLPEKLPREYTATDIAMFSRWYLDDYPVNIWKRPDGLLVIGFIPGSIFNHYISTNTAYIWPLCIGIGVAFIINILLMVYLFVRNAHRVEKSMEPILNGIQTLSQGKAFHLEEKGELAEINAGLNRAGEYLIKKDNTRAEWIRGISHDVRTPLSIIFGYACEIEDNSDLPLSTRKQATAIRQKSEKLRTLIADLNLTTKLEYSMYPLKKKTINAVELARQVASEFLNELPEQYEIEIAEDSPGKLILLNGDNSLLYRMLSNLIGNSMVHNPNGCKITICVGLNVDTCLFDIRDTGCGIDDTRLTMLNNGTPISSTQEESNSTDHGLGLKIVRQIVKAHGGKIYFSSTVPHGLSVKIELPVNGKMLEWYK